jgi:terminal uridylyltransferase
MNNGAWRSHSQAPFDRLGQSPHLEPAHSSSKNRPRHSDGGDTSEYSAQEMWLASQGPNLGGVNNGGFGGSAFEQQHVSSRGRDTQSRGLETPGAGYRGTRRAVSAYDDGAGSGSISAPLSPHRLYAQLEMGKGPTPNQPNWPSYQYDPRLHATPGMPVISSSSHRNVGGSRSASIAPSTSSIPVKNTASPSSPLPAFAPFSPVGHNSTLQALNGEPAAYISPSTLLSPPHGNAALPGAPLAATAVDQLASSFGQMGVNPPGQGAEDPSKDRRNVDLGSSRDSRSKPGSPTKKPTL